MGFSFHANTLAFGGQIEQDGRTIDLPIQASIALPPGGGSGEVVSGPFDSEGISFRSARSYVTGNVFKDSIYTTVANVSVNNVDIKGRVQVQAMNAIVTSINERDASGCMGESHISFDVTMAGLVIDGNFIRVDFNTAPFKDHGTFGEFVDSFPKMPETEAKTLIEAFDWPIDECRTVISRADLDEVRYHVPRRCTTGIRASLLRRTTPLLTTRGEIPGVTRRGYTIEVAGLGLIHLGEVLLKAGRRRVNLMRVELGKTLDSTTLLRAPLAGAGGEPRLVATAFAPAGDMIALASPPTPPGGSYTFATGEGNGTDFLP